MKILVLHAQLGVLNGGGEHYSRSLMTQMVQRGHSVTAIFTTPLSGRYPYSLPAGFFAEPLRTFWRRTPGQNWLTRIGQIAHRLGVPDQVWRHIQQAVRWRTAYWYNRRYRTLCRHHLQDRWQEFDLAYVHGDTFLAADAAKQIVTCLRLPGPVSASEIGLFKNIHCVCANGDAHKQMSKLTNNIRFLPVGVDLDWLQSNSKDFRQELGLQDRIVFGYVGRLAHIKGVNEMINAFIEISDLRSDLHLLIVGDGEMRAALEARVIQAGLQSRCDFVGNQDKGDIPSWYRTMDIFMMPSHYENFSNAIVEAMACRLPVIASNVGGNSELVIDGQTGWLFEYQEGGSTTLPNTIQKCLEQYDDWSRMGEQAYEKVKYGYSWAQTGDTLETLMVPFLGQIAPTSSEEY